MAEPEEKQQPQAPALALVKSIHKECSQFQSTLNYLAAFTKLNCESAGGEGNSSHLFPQIPTMARWSGGTRARLTMLVVTGSQAPYLESISVWSRIHVLDNSVSAP